MGTGGVAQTAAFNMSDKITISAGDWYRFIKQSLYTSIESYVGRQGKSQIYSTITSSTLNYYLCTGTIYNKGTISTLTGFDFISTATNATDTIRRIHSEIYFYVTRQIQTKYYTFNGETRINNPVSFTTVQNTKYYTYYLFHTDCNTCKYTTSEWGNVSTDSTMRSDAWNGISTTYSTAENGVALIFSITADAIYTSVWKYRGTETVQTWLQANTYNIYSNNVNI